MKRIFALILALLCLLTPLSVFAEELTATVTAEAPAAPAKDAIYDLALDAQGVYLFNPETGTALYEKAENARMFPASTTKILTALVVLENCADPRTETITVESMSMFDYIIADGGVHMALKSGETFTVYDLLAGLMISSYCDVADLLAFHFGGGSVDAFIEKMNQKVADLGLENSHFENAHGLHGKNHYSSPKDIAMILQEAVKSEIFREILTLRNHVIPATSRSGERKLRHTISAFYDTSDWYLPCYVGGKSGFTDQAGRCLATYSTQDGVSYISVLLGANMDGNRSYPGNMAMIETHTLLSYVYEHFSIKTVVEKGTEMAKLPVVDSEQSVSVVAGETVTALLRNETEPSYEVTLPKSLEAPEVADGKEIGSLRLSFNTALSERRYPLVISWDGVPIVTKSKLEKGAEGAAKAVTGIFTTDKTFVILFILLLLVIFVTLPVIRITHRLHRKKSHKPKH